MVQPIHMRMNSSAAAVTSGGGTDAYHHHHHHHMNHHHHPSTTSSVAPPHHHHHAAASLYESSSSSAPNNNGTSRSSHNTDVHPQEHERSISGGSSASAPGSGSGTNSSPSTSHAGPSASAPPPPASGAVPHYNMHPHHHAHPAAASHHHPHHPPPPPPSHHHHHHRHHPHAHHHHAAAHAAHAAAHHHHAAAHHHHHHPTAPPPSAHQHYHHGHPPPPPPHAHHHHHHYKLMGQHSHSHGRGRPIPPPPPPPRRSYSFHNPTSGSGSSVVPGPPASSTTSSSRSVANVSSSVSREHSVPNTATSSSIQSAPGATTAPSGGSAGVPSTVPDNGPTGNRVGSSGSASNGAHSSHRMPVHPHSSAPVHHGPARSHHQSHHHAYHTQAAPSHVPHGSSQSTHQHPHQGYGSSTPNTAATSAQLPVPIPVPSSTSSYSNLVGTTSTPSSIAASVSTQPGQVGASVTTQMEESGRPESPSSAPASTVVSAEGSSNVESQIVPVVQNHNSSPGRQAPFSESKMEVERATSVDHDSNMSEEEDVVSTKTVDQEETNPSSSQHGTSVANTAVSSSMDAPSTMVSCTSSSLPPPPGTAPKPSRPVNPQLIMKSPVTLCFERMLGAAEYLAHNPTPEVVKTHLKKRKDMDGAENAAPANSNIMSTENDLKPMAFSKGTFPLSTNTMSSGLETIAEATVSAAMVSSNMSLFAPGPSKRSKTMRALPMKELKLQEGNPFLEIEQDEELYNKVILQMALISESKETKRIASEPVSHIIGEGFYWRDYQVLEEILFDNMKNYYSMSSQNRQSRHQQEFNNRLVASIRQAALENGFQFDPTFNDKRLRDRIRCFYKTHLQNAKKRLATLQKHPNSPIHQSHLRIYIRCVKQNLSVEASEALEPTPDHGAPKVVLRKPASKRRSEDGVTTGEAATSMLSNIGETAAVMVGTLAMES